MPIKVSIVEDRADLRAEFADLIDGADGLACVSRYADAETALAHLPAEKPDVVLMDINLPGMTGVEAVRRLKAVAPAIQIVMLTVFEHNEWIFESLKAGAAGYVLKRADRGEIVDAVRLVHDGGAPMSISVARKVVQFFSERPKAASELDTLTEREMAVLEKIAQGLSYAEIAESLSISVNTVRKHIRSIYEKLQVNSRTEAAMKLAAARSQDLPMTKRILFVLLLVPVLLVLFSAPAEAWCVQNRTDRQIRVEFSDPNGTYYREVFVNRNPGEFVCETILFMDENRELQVRVTTSHGFDGIAKTKAGAQVYVDERDRSHLGIAVKLVFIETWMGAEFIDYEPPWAKDDDSSIREVRFLATADPQYISHNDNNGSADEYKTLADRIMSLAKNLVGTGDRRGRRGVLVAGDLTHDAYYQTIGWYFQSMGGPGGRFDSQFSSARLFYDGLGNHDYTLSLDQNGCELIGQCPEKLWNDVRDRKRQTNYTHRAGGEAVHYSWDWHDVHFVQLNLAPVDGLMADPGSPGQSFDPFNALSFLKSDLAQNVGTSNRPVVLVHHYGMDCFSTGNCSAGAWWTEQQREDFWAAIAEYNVVALVTGHVHSKVDEGLTMIEWDRPAGRTDGPNRILDVVAGAARGNQHTEPSGAMTDFLIERDWLYAGRLDDQGMGARGTTIYERALIYFGTPHADIDPDGTTCDTTGCDYRFKAFPGISEPPAGLSPIPGQPAPVTYSWSTTCGVPITVTGTETAKVRLAHVSATLSCTVTVDVENSRDPRKRSVSTHPLTHAPRVPSFTVLPGDVTLEATSPAGDVYTYAIAAYDHQDGALAVTCSTPSGSRFLLGATTVTCSASDSEGHALHHSFVVTARDTIPPVVTAVVTPSPNGLGWHTTRPTLMWNVSDALGIQHSTGCDTVVNIGDTPTSGNAYSCKVKDFGGNEVTVPVTIRVDTIAPTITYGAPVSAVPVNAHGWYRTVVNVPYTITDNGSRLESGLAEETGSLAYTLEGVDITYDVSAHDRAGNPAIRTSPALSIDRTPPAISAARDRAANGFNWYRADVTVTFTCSDGLSQIDTCTAPQTVGGEGTGLSAAGVAVDKAGNQTPLTEGGINIDRTPPSADVQRLTPANANGWNNTPVRVRFVASDSLSGLVAPLDQEQDVTSEGKDQRISMSVLDKAGNGAADDLLVSIDLTKPVITSQRSRDPNANGWYNADVEVSFACTDALSGIDSCSPPATVGGEGADLSATGRAVDLAGNEAVDTEAGINLDKTPPVIIGTRLTPANAHGWNNTDVQVSFSCSDTLSTIGTCGPTLQTITEEGMNLSRSASATDLAGNQASATVGGVHIDKTAPVVQCSAAPDVLWPANHKLVPVATSVTVDGGAAGGAGFVLRSATSNEPAGGDIVGFVIGSPSTSGQLRATRDPKGSGRVYSLVYEGADRAGNLATCQVGVRVPRTGKDK